MRSLTLLLFIWFSAISHAVNVFDGATGELHLPIVSVDNEYFEVYLQHQGELTFAVTLVNSASRAALQELRRKVRMGSALDSFDLSTGILSLANVQFGADLYEVSMIHQGNMVFSVSSANPLADDDSGAVDGSDDGRDRVTNPPVTADYKVTATQINFDEKNSEVNMPYVKLGEEFYEVDLVKVDDITYEVKAASSPLRFRTAPSDFNTYDPSSGVLTMPGLQIGSELFEVTMEHLGSLVFTVSTSQILANDLDDGSSDDVPTRGSRR